jgi:2-methylcitrate dehydratase PrpD
VRGLRDGFSVRNGITAALLAREGVVGDVTAFEGRFGLFNAFFRGEYDRSVLVDGLGARFHCADVSIKPWPSARETHATIHCALELREAHAIAADAIDAVVLTVGRPNLEFCEPGDQRRRPARRMDALSSLPFAVSVAFVRVRLRDGSTLTRAVRHGFGHPGAPLPEAVRRAKFADCLRLLPGGADRGLADRLFDALLGVDDRPVADLTALLS